VGAGLPAARALSRAPSIEETTRQAHEPDYLGTWLPGASLIGIGIGLAFPALGTAILVAIVGDPGSLAESLRVSDAAYLFAALASVASGVVALGLRRQRAPGPLGLGEADREAAVAGADLDRVAADLAQEHGA
jgi:hypothetical protein